MTVDQATNYGTLFATFVLAFLGVWNARRANKKADAIHTLVNGGRTQDLSNLVDLTKRISEITKAPEDVALHGQAVKNLQAHKDSYIPPLTTPSETPTNPT